METTAAIIRSARCPLKDIGRSLRVQLGGPAAYRLAGGAWVSPHFLGGRNLVPRTIGGSPSGRKVFFSHVVLNPDGTPATEIVVWETKPLRLAHKLVSERFAQLIPYDNPPPGPRKNLEAVRFVGEEYLAVGLGEGILQLYSLTDGLMAEAPIGGSVGDLACSNTHLAASLFPGQPYCRLYECCGVKEYALEQLLAGNFAATNFISAEDFGFIPHTLQYDASASRLICLGGSTHGERVTNKTVVWDIPARRSSVVLRDKDTCITHTISDLATDGACALVGRHYIVWFDHDLKPLTRRRRPSALLGGRAWCWLRACDGSLFLEKDGAISIYPADCGRAAYLSELGCAELLHIRQDGALVLLQHRGDTYQLAALDPETLQVVEESEASSAVETIPTHGYDCAGDGTLAVADRTSMIRVFNWEARTACRVPSDCGPVAQILADRSQDRFGVLGCSGAISVLRSDEATPRPYEASFSGKPVSAPTGFRKIRLSRYRDPRYFLLFSGYSDYISESMDGLREVNATGKCGGCELMIDERDWSKSRWNTLVRFSVEAPVCAGDILGDKAAFVLADGTLVLVDPYRYCLESQGDRKLLKHDGAYSVLIRTEDIVHPQGLCAVADVALAIWANDGVWFIELGAHYEILRNRHRAIQGVRNIKWDRARDRLLVLMSTHLSVWSLSLQERFNLYVLRDGYFMVHVRYPGEMCVDDEHHPGYFWSDHPDPLSFWEVIDARGNVIRDQRERAAYLGPYCNRFMVERATSDYDRFVRDLRGVRQVGLPVSQRLLSSSRCQSEPGGGTHE